MLAPPGGRGGEHCVRAMRPLSRNWSAAGGGVGLDLVMRWDYERGAGCRGWGVSLEKMACSLRAGWDRV